MDEKQSEVKKLTPMMEQYYSIKAQAGDALLFFRLGDFYEMFGDDAILASRLLDLTLTKRNKDSEIPLAGIPYHAADSYISKLISLGHNVAICEQVEDPKEAKGIVRREIIRTVTPGTIIDSSLQDKSNNFLAAVCECEGFYGICHTDTGTGEFYAKEYPVESGMETIINEMIRISPAECLVDMDIYENVHFTDALNKAIQNRAKRFLNSEYIKGAEHDILTEHFSVYNLEGYGIEGRNAVIKSAAMILDYLRETQKSKLTHINRIQLLSTSETMILDRATQANLELIRNFTGEKRGTLLFVLDRTRTNMGGRLLKKVILNPLVTPDAINRRLDIVEELFSDIFLRNELSDLLGAVTDIERCIGRLVYGSANARDLLMLKVSLEIIPAVKKLCSQGKLSELCCEMKELTDTVKLIEAAISPDAPLTLKEGRIIREGFDAELDQIREMVFSGKEWLKNLEEQEKERTGIKSLKVRYNSVFGYYIEVTKSNLSMVPDYYIRKQTLSNCERFFTPELKEKESQILGANDRMCSREYEIFNQIKGDVLCYTQDIQHIASVFAQLDVYLSFAEAAAESGYIRPIVDDSKDITIIDGRHPVVEKIQSGELFVPNDTTLDTESHQLIILTGPNMAGKSTYIRQVALITLMAQIGCFIPAAEARIGVVDRIFTRVGASDNLFLGLSTFMMEMNETANILNSATDRSLIILDEIGRGTSTFDGISIAWAIAEYIHNYEKLRAKTLFATHYHELTELSKILKRVRNYSIAVSEKNGEIVFLRKIIEGGADRSYGIHVAKLAGLPDSVVERATEILKTIENPDSADDPSVPIKKKGKIIAPGQLSLFHIVEEKPAQPVIAREENQVIKELISVDINSLTPLEAMTVLYKLQQKARRG